MQLSRRARQPGAPRRGFIKTGVEIVKKETPMALYKGLGAVMTGIVPKMAIRFTSFESYKQMLADPKTGNVTGQGVFLAGLAAGVTEAVAVVTPMEVIKIRLQAQHHSMADPMDIPKYRNAAHALYTVVKEEGFGALYRGVSLTALRQGTNQAVNFTAYSYFKVWLKEWQPQYENTPLPSWQTTLIGLVSGAMGPLSNAPIDTIKTRLQKTPAQFGETAWSRIARIAQDMFKYVSSSTFSRVAIANRFTGKRDSTPSTRASPPESCESPPARPSPSPSTSSSRSASRRATILLPAASTKNKEKEFGYNIPRPTVSAGRKKYRFFLLGCSAHTGDIESRPLVLSSCFAFAIVTYPFLYICSEQSYEPFYQPCTH